MSWPGIWCVRAIGLRRNWSGLLHQMGYSLQAPAKPKEGTAHPDRDGQFGYINKLVTASVKERSR